ncbi:hypothetical protein EG359_10460 [Chryseobacterium joostei]|uniref:Lipoprotein n=1 Tax=Chryseobacterium joostei TaxID=112234 RepID=A0A1N7IFY3_9FLAO|nr:hypothetical protein [Chryseobacterium joostei]AZB00019.1 hypothetical protein EG359_10460 [Chryseobacterium joostei]SIS35997.1 hypothetical protein SAMN05421768_10510 [Chryseobacterium joostei]
MKLSILLLLLFASCSNKVDSTQEDISNLFEISLNACNDVKQYYHFEIKNRRNINIVFKRINNPLTRKIKCFGILVNENDRLNENGNLIEILDYKTSSNKFYILYKIVNQGAVVEINMERKKEKWELLNCNIIEI